MYFETHAHLDDQRFAGEQKEVIERALRAGVKLILNIGCSAPQTWYNEALLQEHDFIYAAVGVHPHEAAALTPANREHLLELSQKPKVVAIGEVGLDYHYDFAPRSTQQQVLREMIVLARERQIPLIIHCREAYADTLRILKEEKAAEVGGVFHCFSGNWVQAQELMQLGFHLALGGVVTFPKAVKAVEVARKIPLEYLLLETDCPYLAPVPYRGQRNEPAYVVKVAEKVAELRGITVQEVAQATWDNGRRLFKIAADPCET